MSAWNCCRGFLSFILFRWRSCKRRAVLVLSLGVSPSGYGSLSECENDTRQTLYKTRSCSLQFSTELNWVKSNKATHSAGSSCCHIIIDPARQTPTQRSAGIPATDSCDFICEHKEGTRSGEREAVIRRCGPVTSAPLPKHHPGHPLIRHNRSSEP